jgi:rhodanese-related sulfurtransferase
MQMKRVIPYLVAVPGAVLLLAGAAFLFVTRTESGFRIYLDRLYNGEFPDVGVVMPEELARELGAAAPPIMLDVRSAEEYAVSHLPGAMLTDPATFSDQQLGNLDRGRPVVVYCSVGYRSGRMAQKLASAGFTNVRNLYGGIFLWYNQGREVVRIGGRVQQIHPYDRLWGMFVTREGKTTTVSD